MSRGSSTSLGLEAEEGDACPGTPSEAGGLLTGVRKEGISGGWMGRKGLEGWWEDKMGRLENQIPSFPLHKSSRALGLL